MILNPFQVRLKNTESPLGYTEELVGTVVGVIPTKTDKGVHEVYKVLWFNYDEETGDTTPNLDAAAPSSHLATELVGHVDFLDEEEEEVDNPETDNDLFDDPATTETAALT